MTASQSKVRELLATLVGFDTTSSKSNLALIGFVEDYFKSHGIGSLRVSSPDGFKSDLFATIGGSGKGGIVVAIQDELGIPTRFVGTGEQLNDFAPFDRRKYIENLL